MDKTLLMVMVVLALGILTIGSALAQTVPSGATVLETDLGRYPDSVTTTINLTAGNIKNADLTADTATLRWSGLLGTAAGTLYLGDSGSDYMYDWTALGRVVYAVETGAVTWLGLNDATAEEVETEFPHLANDTFADSYNNTFTGASELLDSDIFTVSSDYALTYDSLLAPVWKTYSLQDGAGLLIFAGLVDTGGTSYSGSIVDYQMIIPEDGTQMNAVTTPWNMYVELI